MPHELNEEYRQALLALPEDMFYAGIASEITTALLPLRLDAEMIDEDCNDPNVTLSADTVQPTIRNILLITERLNFFAGTLMTYAHRRNRNTPP